MFHKICFVIILAVVITTMSYSQDDDAYFDKKLPAYSIGFHFGYGLYFPTHINDYIDQMGYSSSVQKEHIYTNIDVGLLASYQLNKKWEIVPEFSFAFSKRAFKYVDMDVSVKNAQYGATVFYMKNLMPGINLRIGGGVAYYSGKVSWEAGFSSPQEWKGGAIGYHVVSGPELILSPKMSVSFLLIGRYAKIDKLKHDKLGYIIKKTDGSYENLELNFSGFDAKVMVNYYF